MKHYDIITVGLGAMGSATLYQLSKRTKNVLGIDQFSPPHNMGSSSGETRITRLANGEGAAYIPLVFRSNEIWKELEKETGESLLVQNGGLILATEDVKQNIFHGKKDFLAQTIEIAKKHNIKHDVLTSEEIRKKFPQFNLFGSETGYYEYEAGFLRPENCIKAQLSLAQGNGAEINTNEKVLFILPMENGEGVTIKTNKDTYTAKKAIVSPGPWIQNFVEDKYKNLFRVYRQVLYWWDSKNHDKTFLPENFPIFIWLFGKAGYYGFPASHGVKSGVKIGFDYIKNTTNPDAIDRKVTENETKEAYRKYIADRFLGLTDTCIKAATCMITFTSDADFIIDTLPEYPQIIVASPCSGGGFKHSAAIGETLAEMAIDGKTSIPMQAFSFNRFTE